jgi:hypothetical protein
LRRCLFLPQDAPLPDPAADRQYVIAISYFNIFEDVERKLVMDDASRPLLERSLFCIDDPQFLWS